MRSPTAESIFSNCVGLEVLSAGTSPDAENAVSGDLIEWADIIFVMEAVHRRRLKQRYQAFLRDKKVIVLGIPDEYGYMDPALVALLKSKVARWLEPTSLKQKD